MKPPFDELHEAAWAEAPEKVRTPAATAQTNEAPSTDAEGLAGTATGLHRSDPQVGVWNKKVLVVLNRASLNHRWRYRALPLQAW